MNLNFSENLKRLRKEKGVTQEKLSEIVGVSAQSVSRWELSICYPDIEMLPGIANYFGVTVDELLSNDTCSKEKDREKFKETINELSDKTTECIDFITKYCQKYPENDYYAYHLIYAIQRYAAGDEGKAEKYMPVLLKYTQRLLETGYRNATIQRMTTLCSEKELDKWLAMVPYSSGFSRRYCLMNRAIERNDQEEAYVQKGINMFEAMAIQLDERLSDKLGARKKAEFQKSILKIMDSFGNGTDIPDGWKCFYAYKQLVLAACLFAIGETAEAWENFDSAIEKCKYVLSLDDEWLDVGGILFSNIKVNKVWNFAIDGNGQKRKLFGTARCPNADMWFIHNLLTDPRWAWFNSVRETQKYKDALEWVAEERKKIDNE